MDGTLFYNPPIRGAVTMKALGIIALIVAASFAVAPTAGAQEACKTEFSLVGKTDLNWHDAAGAINPTLTACPDSDVVFSISIEGATPHDFEIQGTDVSIPAMSEEGVTETATWSTPASGTFTYICNIHPQTMTGTINVAQTATGGDNGGDGSNDSPGFGIVLVGIAGIAAALLARRK